MHGPLDRALRDAILLITILVASLEAPAQPLQLMRLALQTPFSEAIAQAS